MQPGDRNGDFELESSGDFAGLNCERWFMCADTGELDIYTCLALSDASTFSTDTQRLVFKIAAAMIMQLLIPCLLLLREVDANGGRDELSVKPLNSELKFRIIGTTMLLYSLNHMYENCVDECRNMMLPFMFEQGLGWGYCWPILLGELANIIVGAILVLTMYMVFCNTVDGAELILNAVAFNFLGGVDAEFVDSASHADCLQNFRDIVTPFKYVSKNKRFSCWSRLLTGLMFILRMVLIFFGTFLAVAFAIMPDREDDTNTLELPLNYTVVIPWIQ